MSSVRRVLDPDPVRSLQEYVDLGGGEGLAQARVASPVAAIEAVEASGLRGRGGAGFPTGTKWRTVAGMGGAKPTSVVVNAAEGEPGTFKDRAIIRANPYRVLEGALIAAHAVGADRVLVGLKRSAVAERGHLERAISELGAAGWDDGIDVQLFGHSDRYLVGEETALLEVALGNPPFPRVAPPYRAGSAPVGADPTSRAGTELADPEGRTDAAATLVNNVETLANVAQIIDRGADWFRSIGTAASPGSVVCTVSGRTARAGVGEFELGTPLGEVIADLGGGVLGDRIVAVLSGTANAFMTAEALDAPLTWEGLAAVGGGLGSAGFIVIDDEIDIVAVAQGVSRFLSVESCGQCTPCKQDGTTITELLDTVRRSEPADLDELARRTASVTDGARCFLAQQHQLVVDGLLERFPDAVAAHQDGRAQAAEPYPIVPLADIVDGRAIWADWELDVKGDWTLDDGAGPAPADRLDVRSRG